MTARNLGDHSVVVVTEGSMKHFCNNGCVLLCRRYKYWEKYVCNIKSAA